MSTIKFDHLELDHLAAVRVSGDDAGPFLQAQLTADIDALAERESKFAAYCTPKGNVIALLHVTRREADFLVIVAEALRDTLLKELGKYILRAKVKVEPLDAPVISAPNGEGDGGGVRYAVAENANDPAPAGAGDLAAFRAAELENGVAWLGPQTSGAFLPQMLGFERLGAVSFRKGCFPGQEIIARVRYLGKVKQLPFVVRVEGRAGPEPGTTAEVLGADGSEGSAVVIDAAARADDTVLFMVARNLEEAAAKTVVIEGNRLEVTENVQAWATM